jgi:glycine/D-amino acid oxidase-like deaminating enzyme
MKISIVGAGIMGLSTAWGLSKRGHEIRVYDKEKIPNPVGTSVDRHRVYRTGYARDIGYTKMAVEAFKYWEMMWVDLGESFYVPTGLLALDGTDSTWARDTSQTYKQLGIKHDMIASNDLRDRFPYFNAENIQVGLFSDDCGALLADKIVDGLKNYLEGKGVQFYEECIVQLNGDKIIVGEEMIDDHDVLLLSGGAWTADLLPDYKNLIVPSRQVLLYLNSTIDLSKMPVFFDSRYYGLPPMLGYPLKVADHRFTLRGHPDDNRDVSPSEIDQLFKEAVKVFSDSSAFSIVEAKSCYYSATPDERFILDKISEKTWLMGGFSGHGFKLASILGVKMADAIEGKIPADELARWAAGGKNKKSRTIAMRDYL